MKDPKLQLNGRTDHQFQALEMLTIFSLTISEDLTELDSFVNPPLPPSGTGLRELLLLCQARPCKAYDKGAIGAT